MKKMIMMLLCATMVLLAGCSKQEEAVNTGPKIYYVDKDYTKLVAENFTPEATDLKLQIDEYIVALRKDPVNKEYRLAKPKDVNILGYNFGEAGQLQLNFDENYDKVLGIEEVLMRAAIVKTFTQIESVKEVEFFINGLPLSNGDVPVGRMEASNFIDSVGEMTSYSQTATISIFFANEDGNALVESKRQVEYDGSNLLEEIMVQQLIDGPTKQEVGMKKTIPEGTKLKEISIKDRVCSIDFNEEFLEGIEGITDEVTIYSIVNTLVEQTSIDKVQFTVNGEPATYRTISLDQVFERELTLMDEEE